MSDNVARTHVSECFAVWLVIFVNVSCITAESITPFINIEIVNFVVVSTFSRMLRSN